MSIKLSCFSNYWKFFIHLIIQQIPKFFWMYATMLLKKEWEFLNKHDFFLQILQSQRDFTTLNPNMVGGKSTDFSFTSPYLSKQQYLVSTLADCNCKTISRCCAPIISPKISLFSTLSLKYKTLKLYLSFICG